jgi:hypothetical protein
MPLSSSQVTANLPEWGARTDVDDLDCNDPLRIDNNTGLRASVDSSYGSDVVFRFKTKIGEKPTSWTDGFTAYETTLNSGEGFTVSNLGFIDPIHPSQGDILWRVFAEGQEFGQVVVPQTTSVDTCWLPGGQNAESNQAWDLNHSTITNKVIEPGPDGDVVNIDFTLSPDNGQATLFQVRAVGSGRGTIFESDGAPGTDVSYTDTNPPSDDETYEIYLENADITSDMTNCFYTTTVENISEGTNGSGGSGG